MKLRQSKKRIGAHDQLISFLYEKKLLRIKEIKRGNSETTEGSKQKQRRVKYDTYKKWIVDYD